MAERETIDTFVVGTRVRLDVPTIHKTGIVAAYDGRYQDDLVPVKWDGEDGILFSERGLLRRLSDHECDGLPCYDAQCPNSPLGRRTQATEDAITLESAMEQAAQYRRIAKNLPTLARENPYAIEMALMLDEIERLWAENAELQSLLAGATRFNGGCCGR